MPRYNYRCLDCQAQEQRLAGADDHTAVCCKCGGVMLRLDLDVFITLWDETSQEATPWTS